MKQTKVVLIVLLSLTFIIFQSCRTTKFVPDGEYLLSEARVKTDAKGLSDLQMDTYVKQKPNFKTFTIFKLPLYIYNVSGHDTTKWINRTLRNAGEPPVIYDSLMVGETVTNLQRIMTNKGYLDAKIIPEIKLENKKADITYRIRSGEPFRINKYTIHINDSIIDDRILPDSMTIIEKKEFKLPRREISLRTDSVLHHRSLVKKDDLFDLDILDQERSRITSVFRRVGYYDFNKEYIGFVADTMVGNHQVNLELTVFPNTQRTASGNTIENSHKRYIVSSVNLYVDYNPLSDGSIANYQASSMYEREGYRIIYGPRGRYIKPYIILAACFIRPGQLYNEHMTEMTYSAMSQLEILKNVNISYTPYIENDSTFLRCTITCVSGKKQGISAEIEGTNSGGFFGLEAGIGYMHRNAFRGSEQFSTKLRGSYEMITPNFSNFDDNYFEIGLDNSLTFPRFLFPFLNKEFRRNLHATTQVLANYTYQRRPGFFTRTILASGVKYDWQQRNAMAPRNTSIHHTLNLVEISYVHIPNLSAAFDSTLTVNAKQYSFTDQFILATGYNFSKTNVSTNSNSAIGQPLYSMRASIETAGNLLSLAAKIANVKRDENGSRKIFGTQYAQYVRGTFDYSRSFRVDEKNTIAWHLGGGVAYPYGNFKEIPIQKRFFSGGANSVRGWGVRELGPGSFYPVNKDYDNFFYHSGEMRLDASIEFRSKLFWIIELGAFVDAGNIWTIKKYDTQVGGDFRFDRFYKEIALAWGLGVRLDFDYVLLRLDCGWKAYDPSGQPGRDKWPIKKPFDISHNTAWHIAVGYPF